MSYGYDYDQRAETVLALTNAPAIPGTRPFDLVLLRPHRPLRCTTESWVRAKGNLQRNCKVWNSQAPNPCNLSCVRIPRTDSALRDLFTDDRVTPTCGDKPGRDHNGRRGFTVQIARCRGPRGACSSARGTPSAAESDRTSRSSESGNRRSPMCRPLRSARCRAGA